MAKKVETVVESAGTKVEWGYFGLRKNDGDLNFWNYELTDDRPNVTTHQYLGPISPNEPKLPGNGNLEELEYVQQLLDLFGTLPMEEILNFLGLQEKDNYSL